MHVALDQDQAQLQAEEQPSLSPQSPQLFASIETRKIKANNNFTIILDSFGYVSNEF